MATSDVGTRTLGDFAVVSVDDNCDDGHAMETAADKDPVATTATTMASMCTFLRKRHPT